MKLQAAASCDQVANRQNGCAVIAAFGITYTPALQHLMLNVLSVATEVYLQVTYARQLTAFEPVLELISFVLTANSITSRRLKDSHLLNCLLGAYPQRAPL